MDITPTVLELLGAKPLEGPAGMSLKPLIEGAEAAAEERLIYSEATTWGPEQKAVAGRRYKLIYVPEPWETLMPSVRRVRSRRGSSEAYRLPHTRLYDLKEDPSEQHDLAASLPDVVQRYGSALLAIMERNRAIRERTASGLTSAAP